MPVLGTVTPSPGIGSKTFTLGAAYTNMRIIVGGAPGNDSFFRQSNGTVIGSVQKAFAFCNNLSTPPVNKTITWPDSTGAIIEDASWVAWTATGVTINFASIPATVPQMTIEAW